jgi:hypothetical protein
VVEVKPKMNPLMRNWESLKKRTTPTTTKNEPERKVEMEEKVQPVSQSYNSLANNRKKPTN